MAPQNSTTWNTLSMFVIIVGEWMGLKGGEGWLVNIFTVVCMYVRVSVYLQNIWKLDRRGIYLVQYLKDYRFLENLIQDGWWLVAILKNTFFSLWANQWTELAEIQCVGSQQPIPQHNSMILQYHTISWYPGRSRYSLYCGIP